MKVWRWTKLLGMVGICALCSAGDGATESLREAVEATMRNHPELRMGVHTLYAREQKVKQERAGYFPKLDFTARYGLQEKQEPIDETLYPLYYTLSLRQNIFAGTATIGEIDREKLWANAYGYNLLANAEYLALRTSDVYLKVLRHQELLLLAEEDLATHLRIADQIKLRTDARVGSSTDSEQVSSRVALARANVVASKINLADAETSYQAVVGAFPGKLEAPPAIVENIPPNLEMAEEQAIYEHPTLKSANVEIDARRKQHDVAKAPYLPIIDLEVDQHWREDYDTEGKDNELIVMVRLRQNIFNGLKDGYRRVETTQLINEAREIRNNTYRQVVESIRLSWMAHEAYLSRKEFLEERVRAAMNTADSYNQQFNLGKRTLLDVLDTEAEVVEAKKSLVDARYDGLYAEYRILNGLGILLETLGVKPIVEVGDGSEKRKVLIKQGVVIEAKYSKDEPKL